MEAAEARQKLTSFLNEAPSPESCCLVAFDLQTVLNEESLV